MIKVSGMLCNKDMIKVSGETPTPTYLHMYSKRGVGAGVGGGGWGKEPTFPLAVQGRFMQIPAAHIRLHLAWACLHMFLFTSQHVQGV